MVEQDDYPAIYKLDLKSTHGSYFTVMCRLDSSEDYLKFCEDQLMKGYKVIGETIYLKLRKENEEDKKNESL
jgi:hypothetical protein